jgi:hypothetical protein
MPSHKTGTHPDTEQSIARSAAAMIQILGVSAQADANSVAAQFAKLNDAEAEYTWRAIAQGVAKQWLLPKPAISGQLRITSIELVPGTERPPVGLRHRAGVPLRQPNLPPQRDVPLTHYRTKQCRILGFFSHYPDFLGS